MRAGIANAVFNKGMGLIIMRLHTVEPKLQYPHAREAGAGKQRLYLIRNIAQVLRDKFGVYAPLNGVHKRHARPLYPAAVARGAFAEGHGIIAFYPAEMVYANNIIKPCGGV